MRRRAKVDANHGEVVEALKSAGWEVVSLAPLGKGVPDLLARRNCAICRQLGFEPPCGDAEWRLIEVKDGSKPPSAQQLTKAEKEFHQRWPVTVIRSVEEALAL